MNSLTKRLLDLRNNFNMTQEDVAEFLGVGRTTYAMYEQGNREMDYALLVKLADRYRVSLDYLFGRTDLPMLPEKYSQDEIEYIIKSLELYRTMKEKIIKT